MRGEAADPAKRLAASQAGSAAALGPDYSSARLVFVGSLRSPAWRLCQPRAALCLRRRRAPAFSGRPDNIAGQPGTGDRRRHCRRGVVLVLRIAAPKRPHYPAGMPERRDIDWTDCLASGDEPVQAARFRTSPVLRADFLQLLLLHPLGILFAFRILEPLTLNARGWPLSVTIIFTTFLAILLTTPIAYLSWQFIETPCIRYGKQLGRRPTALAVG
jgi:hypothetical protein